MASSEGSAKCPTCGRSDFKSRQGMKTHHKRMHDESIAGVVKECVVCDDEYVVKPYRADESECCSIECKNKHLGEQNRGEAHPRYNTVTTECTHCGLEFNHPKCADRQFCSKECEGEWKEGKNTGEDHPRYQRVTKHCLHCGTEMSLRPSEAEKRKFCGNQCQGQHFTGEDNPFWSGGETQIPYGPGWHKAKKEAVRERDGRTCQHPGCGRTEEEHLEKFGTKHHVHHIQKARAFDDPERRNAMENLITLCHGECHQTWEKMSPLRPAPDN